MCSGIPSLYEELWKSVIVESESARGGVMICLKFGLHLTMHFTKGFVYWKTTHLVGLCIAVVQ